MREPSFEKEKRKKLRYKYQQIQKIFRMGPKQLDMWEEIFIALTSSLNPSARAGWMAICHQPWERRETAQSQDPGGSNEGVGKVTLIFPFNGLFSLLPGCFVPHRTPFLLLVYFIDNRFLF